MINIDNALAVAEAQQKLIPWDVVMSIRGIEYRVRPLTNTDLDQLDRLGDLKTGEAIANFLRSLFVEPTPDEQVAIGIAIGKAYQAHRKKKIPGFDAGTGEASGDGLTLADLCVGMAMAFPALSPLEVPFMRADVSMLMLLSRKRLLDLAQRQAEKDLPRDVGGGAESQSYRAGDGTVRTRINSIEQMVAFAKGRGGAF
jgi:hypothetical protein